MVPECATLSCLAGKKGAPAKINFQDSVIDLVKVDAQMKAAVESFKEELTKFRVGRVSAGAQACAGACVRVS